MKNIYTTGAALTTSPFFGVYAGYYSSSTFNAGGTNGRYISSTTGRDGTYFLTFTGTSASISEWYYTAGDSYSVRCIVDE